MDVQNLISMANNIGQFFESMPDRQQALKDIAAHIKNFWDPRMRQALLSSLDSKEAEGLSAIVLEALLRHRDLLA